MRWSLTCSYVIKLQQFSRFKTLPVLERRTVWYSTKSVRTTKSVRGPRFPGIFFNDVANCHWLTDSLIISLKNDLDFVWNFLNVLVSMCPHLCVFVCLFVTTIMWQLDHPQVLNRVTKDKICVWSWLFNMWSFALNCFFFLCVCVCAMAKLKNNNTF